MLRDTIPKMLNPLVQKQPSRKNAPPSRLSPGTDSSLHEADAMFSAFMKAVENAQADVKEFTDLMKDEISTEVFDQANKSRQENPLGIVPWRHKDYPDWFTLDAE